MRGDDREEDLRWGGSTTAVRPRPRPRRRSRDRPLEAAYLEEAERTLPTAAYGGHGTCAIPSVELWARHLRYAAERDGADLAVLVHEYEDLACSLAARMYRGGDPLDELRQVAMEALVRLLQSFEPERRIPFPGYASPSIVGRLKRHYRDHGWSIRVSRGQMDLHHGVDRAREELRGSLRREATDDEVAARIGRSVEEIRAALVAARARTAPSLDEVGATDVRLEERIGVDDRQLRLVEQRADLRRAVTALDHGDTELLWLYFWEQQSQATIAARYGTNQMQISRRLARALTQLRSAMLA